MKGSKLLLIAAGMMVFQACSVSKTETMWVSGVQTDCDAGSGVNTCLKVNKLDKKKEVTDTWENFYAPIEGFTFEEGYMKKIEVQTEELDKDQVPADASSIKYTLVKEVEKKEDPRVNLLGNWVLSEVNGAGIKKGMKSPTLIFDLKEMRISGNGGCNHYSFEIGELGLTKVRFATGLSTLMECAQPNIEKVYHEALSQVVEYRVDKEALQLINEEGKTILSYTKKEISPAMKNLSGEWKLTEIAEKKIGEVEKTPSLNFDLQEERVSGTDGCNYINGSLENLTDNEIAFGMLMSTKKMCLDMEVPDAFLQALSQVVKYEVSDEVLILKNEQGASVLTFSR